MKVTFNEPGLYLRMRQAYDLWYAEHRMKDELSMIETVASVRSSAQQSHSRAKINPKSWNWEKSHEIG